MLTYLYLCKSFRSRVGASGTLSEPPFSKTPCFTRVLAIFGGFRGPSRGSENVQNHVFSHVFRDFRLLSKFVFFCAFFLFKKCENHVFSLVFGAAGPRFRASFFMVFVRMLFKNVPKTMRFYMFFAFVCSRRRYFVFHSCFCALFLVFFQNVAKTTRFHAFIELRPQILLSLRASGNSYFAFLSLGAA